MNIIVPNTKGFMALISVIFLAMGTLAFSLATMVAAAAYADAADRRDLRNQAHLYAESCLVSIELMAAKDYFLNGPVALADFGCTANVTNDLNGNIAINARATFNGVSFIEATTTSIL